MPGLDWDDLLLSFLHDPPDKALKIPGHESRAARYASAALGKEVSEDALRWAKRSADPQASIIERLPMPDAGPNGERAVSPDSTGQVKCRHALSGTAFNVSGGAVDQTPIRRAIEELTAGLDDPEARFLTVWRLLPERLAAINPAFASLPADTRVPDHTIWHHLDTTAGLAAALANVGGPALLSFSLGPVQPFIAAARSVRDLWSGSAILSWMTFQAMLPVIKKLGPSAFIFPSLRGTPLLDIWLREKKGLASKVAPPSESAPKAPSIPNRFLAVVPWGAQGHEAENLADLCRQGAEEGWKSLTTEVRNRLDAKLALLCPTWHKLWDAQVNSFFEIRTSVLPLNDSREDLITELAGKDSFTEAFPNASAVRSLADAIPPDHQPGYDQKHAGRWQAQVELSARLMEAQRSVRHIPDYHPTGDVPPKCSLMGTYEQIGPAGLDDSGKFWEEARKEVNIGGTRLRSRERLCSIALAKRFAFPIFLRRELGLDKLPFSDTATVAAAKWLKDAGISPEEIREKHDDWSGQWLHWSKQDFDPDEAKVPDDVWRSIRRAKENEDFGSPPAYYAILTIDGDNMGKWLRGDRTPKLADVLHPKMVDYFKSLPDSEKVQKALNSQRPVGPALHAAISEALNNFAIHVVPEIVERHHGTLIYSGGDDVLALLPALSALKCARELRFAFSGDLDPGTGKPAGYYQVGDRKLLVMGPTATLSAGLAVVHYKENLREAIDAARKAEKAAKNSGKDALQLAICRRSGEHSSALCSWDFVLQLEQWAEAFEDKASDRWAYHLRQELPTLSGLPLDAIQAEIRRQVDRAEESTRRLLGNGDPKAAGKAISNAFAAYHAMRERREEERERESKQPGRFVEGFVKLCQSASFLARGRDR